MKLCAYSATKYNTKLFSIKMFKFYINISFKLNISTFQLVLSIQNSVT